MTERIAALTVAFDIDKHPDDVQKIIAAIQVIRGVCGVTAIVVNPIDYALRQRIKQEFWDKVSFLVADF